MTFDSVNSVRRVLGDMSTNALLSPSKRLSSKEHATNEDTVVLPGCDAIMNLPTVAGRKRSIDKVNASDQNHSSFTTVRLSSPETRVDEREIHKQQQDTRETSPIKDSTAETPGIALGTLASKASADSSDMVSKGDLGSQDSETADADGSTTNGGTSSQDHGTASPISPALENLRQGPDSPPTRSDNEQSHLIKIAAAKLRDRLGRAARIYEAKEAREKAAKRARMEKQRAVRRDSVEGHSNIANRTTDRRALPSKLLPSPQLSTSSPRSSRLALTDDHVRSPIRVNDVRPDTSEGDDLETLGSHGPNNRSDREEAISPAARNASIVERAIATAERGMAVDGLLKLMKTTTEYDNLSS